MSSSLLDDEARIQLAIWALEAGICKNLLQAAALYKVPYKRF